MKTKTVSRALLGGLLLLMGPMMATGASHGGNKPVRIDIDNNNNAHLERGHCLQLQETGPSGSLRIVFPHPAADCRAGTAPPFQWKPGSYEATRVAPPVAGNNKSDTLPPDVQTYLLRGVRIANPAGGNDLLHDAVLFVRFDAKGPYEVWISMPETHEPGIEGHPTDHGGAAHGLR